MRPNSEELRIPCPYLRTCAFVSYVHNKYTKKQASEQKTPSEKNVPHCSFVYLCICAPAKEITALGCDFFRPIRRYTDMQITRVKVFMFVSVLLCIRRAETRIFRYRCTDTHTNWPFFICVSVCEAICAQIGGRLSVPFWGCHKYADAKISLYYLLKVAK